MSDICFVEIKASQNTYVNQLAVHGSSKLVIEKHVDAYKTYRTLYPFSFVVLKVESLVTHLRTSCEERYAPWHA